MGVASCYLRKRRIGAYLDSALAGPAARAMAAHLERCPPCQAEAAGLGRLRGLVRESAPVAEPDWTGFWPGIRRGIEAAARPARPRVARALLHRRAALVGAAAAALLAVTVWQGGDSPVVTEGTTTVAIADTEHPDGSVMVYTPPGDYMTVIWVFGLDKPSGAI